MDDGGISGEEESKSPKYFLKYLLHLLWNVSLSNKRSVRSAKRGLSYKGGFKSDAQYV